MPSRRERRRRATIKPPSTRGAAPTRPYSTWTSWSAVETSHGKARFVGVRRWWRWKRGEWGQWGMLYGLGSVFVLPISVMLLFDALDFIDGKVWVSWWELVLAVVLMLAWLGGPLVLGLRPDLVWEAERGRLTLGAQTWSRAEVEAIEVVPGHDLEVWVLPKDGAPVLVARFERGVDEARRAVQVLGDAAGVMVRTRH